MFGKCGMASIKFTENQQINVIFPSESFCSDFLYYCLSAVMLKITALAGERAVPFVKKAWFLEA